MLRSFFGGGTTARAANNSNNAEPTSESKDVETLAKKLTSNLRESISEIEVSPPITRSWLYVNDQIRKVASVVSQEKSSAISSTASDPSSSSVAVKPKGLWESSGFDGVRYLLEAGKLNVMMRIVLEYVMFMQTPSGRESVMLNEAECAAFESNCAIIFQAAWSHVESVQTSELPLSASVLVSIMSICISMGLEGEALRDTSSGAKKKHQVVSEIQANRNHHPHPRPQLMILALTMWSSLGSSKAIAAVGDDKLAKEILRAQPTFSCFALFPVFALLCLNTSAPNNAGSGSSILSTSSSPSSSSSSPPTAAAVELSERNFILLLLSALEGASRISNSEDFLSSRNKLLVEADQAIFKAMATVRSDSAISALNTASTPTIASTCEKLKASLTPDVHPRFAASAGITSMEARAKTRTLIDFCDAAIRRTSKKNEESKE